ncbi:LysR family transcriptional regulator, partial [Escherichia coli]|nr:LysR family transcriptional regulator [Escherichia coli]
KYFDAPHRPMYMQEYLYSIRNHRYTATMLQHIAEDRGEYVRRTHFPDSDADNPDT